MGLLVVRYGWKRGFRSLLVWVIREREREVIFSVSVNFIRF